jgi:stage V sporulation protein R
MEDFINPEEYMEAQKKKLESAEDRAQGAPERPSATCSSFLLDHAPLERWERDVLEVMRDEAYYFLPQMQTKIMNEGWASLLALQADDREGARRLRDHRLRREQRGRHGHLARALNPYKLGVELFRYIEERWDKGQFGKEWDECDDWTSAATGTCASASAGRRSSRCARSTTTSPSSTSSSPRVRHRQKLYTFGFSSRNDRYEIESREFKEVKEKLLFQLTNFGNPSSSVLDANYANRGELLLEHEHMGADLRQDYAKETLQALVRVWKRPVALTTKLEQKTVMVRYDGSEHSVTPYRA